MIKNHRQAFLILGIFLLVFAVSRLFNLTALPIFTDEAIYIRWAQIAKQDASWRFISLTDGKQPLFVWGTMVFLKILKDPLLAGRMVSVLSGALGMIGMYFLSWELFREKKPAILAAFLYLVSPFTLMYDRMALMDGLVATTTIWSLYFGVLLTRTVRLDVALLWSMALGTAVLTKTSGFLNIYLAPALLILFNWQGKQTGRRFLRWAGLVLLAIVISQIYYGVLRLSPWFHMISQKDATFVYPLSEWLQHPLKFLHGNLRGELDWVFRYLTLPFLILAGLSLVFIKKAWRQKLFLLFWFVAPLTGLALFGRVLYPRFVLFMTMPLLILAAWSLAFLSEKIKSRISLAFIFLLFLIYPLFFDAKILFSIITAPLPRSDSNQYVNDWPSGWGVREIVDFAKRESQSQKITIYTEGVFGLLPYSLEIYLVDNPNIEIIGIWPLPPEMPVEMLAKIKERPTYFVLNLEDELPLAWSYELIDQFFKGNKINRSMRLYRLSLPGSAKNSIEP